MKVFFFVSMKRVLDWKPPTYPPVKLFLRQHWRGHRFLRFGLPVPNSRVLLSMSFEFAQNLTNLPLFPTTYLSLSSQWANVAVSCWWFHPGGVFWSTRRCAAICQSGPLSASSCQYPSSSADTRWPTKELWSSLPGCFCWKQRTLSVCWVSLEIWYPPED